MPFRLSRIPKEAAEPQTELTRPKPAPAKCSPEDYLVAHIDGGARGNPGVAGFGVVIEDRGGRLIDEFYQSLGMATNNYAEYSALFAALEYAIAHEYRCLKVLSDSELLVRQIQGQYRVRSAALTELHRRCQALIRQLDWFEIQHIPREQNREADHLANVAMDESLRPLRSAKAAASPAPPAPRPAERQPRAPLQQDEWDGLVRQGVVELIGGTKLPEGARVKVRLLSEPFNSQTERPRER